MADFSIPDQLWQQRHDAQVLDELDKALHSHPFLPDVYELSWRRSRLLHFRALQAMENGNESLAVEFYARGAAEAQKSLDEKAFGVEANFWRAVNALEAGRRSGPFAAVVALSRATRQLERAAHQDETFHFGGPVRVLGRVSHLKPMILGGSLDNAISFLRRARQIAPQNSTTLLYLAEALHADRQPREAKELLREIIQSPRDDDWVWEQARDKKNAQQLLEKWEI
jgi:tetratricopeptide (TPR) repeat protein